MIIPGMRQKLKVEKTVDFGVYLGDGEDRVLLPGSESGQLSVGDEVNAFIYQDSKDRPIATLQEPMLVLDQIQVLRVVDLTKIGAFLDWGLPKDLFLPFKQMRGRVRVGDEILVRLYTDKSGRLAASMRDLYHYLSTQPPYEGGEEVSARIYEFGHDFGTFCAVDDRYSAMLPKHEDVSGRRIGDVLTARITAVKEDGKLDISIRGKVHEQMDQDAKHLLSIIDAYAGVLPFSEKASPEVIKRETGLSKAAFKRAVGRLYKKRLISLEGGTIRSLG